MKLYISLLVLSVVLLVSAACGGEPAPTPAPSLTTPPSPTATAMNAPTPTATPSATPVLATPVPPVLVAVTPTATATLTPTPTATVIQTATPAASSADLQHRLERLVQQLEARRQQLRIPGMAIAVVKDDEVIFVRGFGLADLENETPVTPETIFAVGSIIKSFTATLVGMLVDEGKMDWDDPVTEHLSYFTLNTDIGGR